MLLPVPVPAAEPLVPASPESQGINSDPLRQLSEHVRKQQYDVRAMLLVRHGRLVFEWYAADVTRQHNHNVYSVTKSVVATLAGIAVDRRQLPGVDATLGSFFPGSKPLESDARKSGITLADLLTMRSGLPNARANRPAGPQRVLFDKIHRAEDRVGYILDLPMQGEPGTKFLYGNAEPQLVLAILQQATDRKALALAEEALFRPLEFENYRWNFPDGHGTLPGGYGLRLRAIDMAWLGQLYLQGGLWLRRQIVSRRWIDAATADRTGTGYGYYWWTRIKAGEHDSYAAKGVRGQRIHVIPALDLVFVTTANLTTKQIAEFFPVALDRFILPSVESDKPLPERPDRTAALAEELSTAARYRPAGRAKDNVPQL